jgi:D-alanine-D-alanine ligase
MIKTIGLVYDGSNTKKNTDEAYHAEHQKNETVDQVYNILIKKYAVIKMEVDDKISETLAKSGVDLVFNLSTGMKGESRQSQIPGLLEMLGIPYVGSGVLAHALALNKAMAKCIFQHNHVSTPAFQTFYTGEELFNSLLLFPLIVKPGCEGSGFGIHKDSVVFDVASLMLKINDILKAYEPPALVEEFIEGREFTVGIIGNGINKTILPIMEIDFQNIPEEQGKFYTYEVKNDFGDQTLYHCPATLSPTLEKSIRDKVSQAFDALGCRDVARVDVRVRGDKAYIIEINSLPGLKPEYSDLPKMALVAGLSYEDLILKILNVAIDRITDVT